MQTTGQVLHAEEKRRRRLPVRAHLLFLSITLTQEDKKLLGESLKLQNAV